MAFRLTIFFAFPEQNPRLSSGGVPGVQHAQRLLSWFLRAVLGALFLPCCFLARTGVVACYVTSPWLYKAAPGGYARAMRHAPATSAHAFAQVNSGCALGGSCQGSVAYRSHAPEERSVCSSFFGCPLLLEILRCETRETE